LLLASSRSCCSKANSSCVNPKRVGETSIPFARPTLSTMSTIRQSSLPVSGDNRKPLPTYDISYRPCTCNVAYHLGQKISAFRGSRQDYAVDLIISYSFVFEKPRANLPPECRFPLSGLRNSPVLGTPHSQTNPAFPSYSFQLIRTIPILHQSLPPEKPV
jgi:hypothetical protein